ncbi:MAG TPA: phospholipase D-like domain-containing protein [Myxococcales bacterium]|jgi:phosphatidylserine/phosphatidylglycerophosphate/cardiolipin synthase-like enzyme|nr:phospholipase D-like domain-containing protein [Myxococcales bacterium]
MKACFVLAALLACAHAPPPVFGPPGALELVESEPVATSLDDGGLREAWRVWPEMIGAAESSIDLAQFYVSDEGQSRLTPVIQALEAAVKRGVRVRFLADAGFAKTYPQMLAELAATGAQVVKYKLTSGGVLHAKYFVVDEKTGYLGSQNFDWRSLQHIQELGVRFTEPHAVRALEDVFELDWALAQGVRPPKPLAPPPPDEAPVTLLEDPRGLLVANARFELPKLIALIDSAKRSFRIQTLTYAETPELTEALVRAAARGVKVQLLTSDWELRPKTAAALMALDPRIEVKILAIPPVTPFIPYARVAHAKYCVADGERGVVSTSNWERDYFEKSRNVALLIEAGEIPKQLERFFERNWNSPYAEPFDKAAERKPPRISQR